MWNNINKQYHSFIKLKSIKSILLFLRDKNYATTTSFTFSFLFIYIYIHIELHAKLFIIKITFLFIAKNVRPSSVWRDNHWGLFCSTLVPLFILETTLHFTFFHTIVDGKYFRINAQHIRISLPIVIGWSSASFRYQKKTSRDTLIQFANILAIFTNCENFSFYLLRGWCFKNKQIFLFLCKNIEFAL